jgi:ABC-2 type transport system permease protein
MSTVAALRPSGARQTAALVGRSVKALAREAHLLAPSLIFPLFFAALSAGSFNQATRLPGFPEVDSFLDFLLAGSIFQGVLFGSIQGATGLAADIEGGFFERLVASPVSRPAIVLGRLGGAFVLGAVQALLFVVVFSVFGVTVKAGPAGYVLLVLAGGLVAVAFGGVLAAIAVTTGSQEAVQSLFPLVFISLFLSSAFFPRETMSGWYGTVADWNPVSHIVEGMRTLVIDDLTASAVWWSVGVPSLASVATVSLALWALRRRMARR